jgi:hypothetical protein
VRLRRPRGVDAEPARTPHPDSRVEAQLQQVLSRYTAVRRTEARLADIRSEQLRIDVKTRRKTGYNTESRHLAEQAARLRAERLELEALISGAHREIAEVLTSLGDDALYLGPVP